MRLLLALIVALTLFSPAYAVVDAPNALLKDPALEQQAQEIFSVLRCPVCEGQSLNSSNADLAKDMRQIIRIKLQDGQNKDQIITFLTDRYGPEIDMSPTFSITTALLYLLPVAILLLGIGVFSGLFIHRAALQKKAALDAQGKS